MLELIQRVHVYAKMRQEGASAVEYGLLVAAIAAVIVAVLFLFGSTIEGVFKTTCNSIKSSAGPGCG
ncbi:MAG: Flp family type IVb pilin [Actinomycetota bacterium]|nr:Flp family type IVb pilin [Actinomycetota bacterium]